MIFPPKYTHGRRMCEEKITIKAIIIVLKHFFSEFQTAVWREGTTGNTSVRKTNAKQIKKAPTSLKTPIQFVLFVSITIVFKFWRQKRRVRVKLKNLNANGPRSLQFKNFARTFHTERFFFHEDQ